MGKPVKGIIVSIAMLIGFSDQAVAQTAESGIETVQLRFKFAGAPWRSVVEWLAESGGYALHVNDLPLGSFTYLDERAYTLDEAINRINMFLIPQRYTLVRNERLLSVVSLDDESSVRQLDSMAKTVAVEELQHLADHELVKCFFPLGSIAPDHATEELSSLMLIREPSVLRNTNQLLLIDTADKLRTVNQVLGSLARPSAATGPVKRFELGDLDPEKTLVQVRPHVGLDPLAMIGADIRLSLDKERRQLLASGSDENLLAISSVIALLLESDMPSVPGDELIFRPHDLQEADMQTVVNVLQTLLAEEDVQMAADTKSNQLAIRANVQVHELVDETIRELSGSHNAVAFKVIEVKSVDARYAAVVLNDMFFATQTEQSESDGATTDVPRIDADSLTGRLFIRARKSQLEEIDRALQQFDRESATRSSNLRLLPYRGGDARMLLDSAIRFWPHEERIELLPSQPSNNGGDSIEREIDSEPPSRDRSDDEVTLTRLSMPLHEDSGQWDSSQAESECGFDSSDGNSDDRTAAAAADTSILVQQTAGGLLIHSASEDAIERFEEHLALISGYSQSNNRKLSVFYLKHAKIDDANALLQQLLADELQTHQGNPASLARLSMPQYAIDAAGGDVAVAWGYNTATVLPDKRLNRLFVHGTQQELDTIEKHLQIIDRENSITDLKTRGTPRMILLHHARAEDVASLIRDAYSGRIASTAKERNAAAAASNERLRTPQGRDQGQTSSERSPAVMRVVEGDEDKMTLAVDARSNVIVVTAPSQLAEEVEALARDIDDESRQTVQLLPVDSFQLPQLQETLKHLFGDRVVAQDSQPRPTSKSR